MCNYSSAEFANAMAIAMQHQQQQTKGPSGESASG